MESPQCPRQRYLPEPNKRCGIFAMDLIILWLSFFSSAFSLIFHPFVSSCFVRFPPPPSARTH